MHGTDRAYRDGCHCDECRGWNAERVRRWRRGERKRHWWRDLCHSTWVDATMVWEAAMERENWETERAEYRSENPPPRYRDVLENLSSGVPAF